MREILFRGKMKATGEWSYGNLNVNVAGICIITPDDTPVGKYGQVIPETVGQYTGLTDKNGTKIFEGDIVNIVYDAYTPTVINLVIQYVGASFYGATDFDFWELDNYYEIEVVGNIHDNPKLLGDNNGV